MEDQPTKNNGIGKVLLFVSGIGILALAGYLLVFGQNLFAEEPLVANVQITPASADSQRVNQIIDETELAGAIQVEDIAPGFYLDNSSGEQISLEALRGQPVIVNFWATWCAPCRVEMPEFEQALNDYEDENLVILALNREEDPGTVANFFSEENLFDTELDTTFLSLFDTTATVAEAYGVFNMPTTYFINAEGEVTAVHRGPLARVQLDDYMAQTLE